MAGHLVGLSEDVEVPEVFPNIFSLTVGQLEEIGAPLGIVVQKIGNSPYKLELLSRIFMRWAELEQKTQTKFFGTVIMLCRSTHSAMLEFASNNGVPDPQYPEIKEHKSGTMQRILDHIRQSENDTETAPIKRSSSIVSQTRRLPDLHPTLLFQAPQNTYTDTGLLSSALTNRSTSSISRPKLLRTSGGKFISDVDCIKVFKALDAYVQSLTILLPTMEHFPERDRNSDRLSTSQSTKPIPARRIRDLEDELDNWEDDICGGELRVVTEAERLYNIREIIRELFGQALSCSCVT